MKRCEECLAGREVLSQTLRHGAGGSAVGGMARENSGPIFGLTGHPTRFRPPTTLPPGQAARGVRGA